MQGKAVHQREKKGWKSFHPHFGRMLEEHLLNTVNYLVFIYGKAEILLLEKTPLLIKDLLLSLSFHEIINHTTGACSREQGYLSVGFTEDMA